MAPLLILDRPDHLDNARQHLRQPLHGASRWLDIFVAYDRLSSARPLAEFPLTALALSLWVLVPLVLGVARSLRREVA